MAGRGVLGVVWCALVQWHCSPCFRGGRGKEGARGSDPEASGARRPGRDILTDGCAELRRVQGGAGRGGRSRHRTGRSHAILTTAEARCSHSRFTIIVKRTSYTSGGACSVQLSSPRLDGTYAVRCRMTPASILAPSSEPCRVGLEHWSY